MISSRHPITSLNGTTLFLINSLAFPAQTSVPCDKPEILTSSPKVLGLVSTNIWITKLVPSSGRPRVPVGQSISSSVTPSSLVLERRENILLSSIGKVVISRPDKSWSILRTVGLSWPRISSFKTSWSMAW